MAELRPERMIALREERGLSQAALARETGIGQSTVVRLEKGGTRNPREALAIARALNCSVEYLLGESDERGSMPVTNDDRLPFLGAPAAEPDRLLPRGKVAKVTSRKQAESDVVEVAEIDLRFGLGGAFMDQEIVEHQAHTLPFPRAWLRMITSSPVQHLYWARGVGDSMEPKISDGDVILIDRSQTDPSFGDLYWAIAYGQTGMIKRLRPMPDGSVKILSDNPNVPPEVAYDGELNVFGRVVAVVKRV